MSEPGRPVTSLKAELAATALWGLTLIIGTYVALCLAGLPWHNLVCRRGHYESHTAYGFRYEVWVCEER